MFLLEEKMSKYMLLMKLTEKGACDLKGQPEVIEGGIKVFEEMGGKVIGVYACGTLYDYVAIGEVPNDEVAEMFRRLTMSMGLVKAQFIRLFTLKEFTGLIDALKLE
jgi:uncharacterized protein with GYD domain